MAAGDDVHTAIARIFNTYGPACVPTAAATPAVHDLA